MPTRGGTRLHAEPAGGRRARSVRAEGGGSGKLAREGSTAPTTAGSTSMARAFPASSASRPPVGTTSATSAAGASHQAGWSPGDHGPPWRSDARLLDVAGDGSSTWSISPRVSAASTSASQVPASNAGLDAGWGRFRRVPGTAGARLERRQPALRRPDRRRHRRHPDHRGCRFPWHPSLLAARVSAPGSGYRRRSMRMTGRASSSPTATQSIYLADMSGDGLTDIVRIRNGEVCYWPNRGYGRFGAKVVMDRSPGSTRRGCSTDGASGSPIPTARGRPTSSTSPATAIHVYLNESGNALSAAQDSAAASCRRRALPRFRSSDFLGRGTACLVWSSPLPSERAAALRYVDLMRGREAASAGAHHQQPRRGDRHRLRVVDRVLPRRQGGGTALGDAAALPVHVVKRVETYDYVSRNRFVTRLHLSSRLSTTGSSASFAASAGSTNSTPRNSPPERERQPSGRRQ